MAKSSRGRKGGQQQSHQNERDTDEQDAPATAVAEQQPEPAQPPPPQRPEPQKKGGSDDVSAIDAETNAKYEQVKSGKLYIKDLQQMDAHQLHEIARQEN